jgi:hypothetical protein
MNEELAREILRRLTAPSKSGEEYDKGIARMIWVARQYSKADLVNNLRRAIDGGEGNTEET